LETVLLSFSFSAVTLLVVSVYVKTAINSQEIRCEDCPEMSYNVLRVTLKLKPRRCVERRRQESRWGCSLSANSGIWGALKAPQRGPGQSPVRKRISAYFEGHRTSLLHLYANALSSSNSASCHVWGSKADVWGQLPPCPIEPPLGTAQ